MSGWVKVVEAPAGEAQQAWAAWLAALGLAADSVDQGEMRIDTIRSSGAGMGATSRHLVRYFVSIDEARRLGLPEVDE